MSILAQRAAGAAWWSALEIASRYGVQFVVTAILARLLTPGDFGVVAVVVVFTTLASIFVDSGFGTALIQRGSPTADERTTVAAYAFVVAIAAAALIAFAAPALAHFFKQPELIPLLRAAVWVLPLSALSVVPDAILTLRLRFRARTMAQLLASVISGAAGIMLAWNGAGSWSLVVQLIVAAAVRSFMLIILSRDRQDERGRVTLDALRRLAAFGTYMLLAGVIDAMLTRVQAVLLARLADVRQVGFYSLAQTAQLAPATFIGSILNRVGLPVFVQIADDPVRLRGAMSSALRVSMFCFAPCMLLTAALARPIVIAIYGAMWAPAIPLLSIMAIGTLWWPVHVLNLAALSALGRSDLFFRLEVAKALVLLGMLAAAAPHGAVAIATATAFSSFLAVVINTWHARRLLGYGALSQLHDIAAPLLVGCVAVAAAWVVLYCFDSSIIGGFWAALVASALYVGIAKAAHLRAWHEFTLMLKRSVMHAEGP